MVWNTATCIATQLLKVGLSSVYVKDNHSMPREQGEDRSKKEESQNSVYGTLLVCIEGH